MYSAVELGTFTAYADRFSSFRVVSVEDIIAPMALCKIQARSTLSPHDLVKLWVAILYDRVRCLDLLGYLMYYLTWF